MLFLLRLNIGWLGVRPDSIIKKIYPSTSHIQVLGLLLPTHRSKAIQIFVRAWRPLVPHECAYQCVLKNKDHLQKSRCSIFLIGTLAMQKTDSGWFSWCILHWLCTETFTLWAINPWEDGQPIKVDGQLGLGPWGIQIWHCKRAVR